MNELSPTVKRSIELLGLVLLGYVICIGKDVITPMLMAFFLSILLLPVYRFFKKKLRLPEAIAIVMAITALAIVLAGVMWFFGAQVAALVSDIPAIQANLTIHWQTLTHWVEAHTPLSVAEQMKWLNGQSDAMLKNGGSMLSGAAVSLSGIFIFVGLLPIYIFLMLFYKNLLMRFVYLWFPQQDHETVTEALLETESIIKSYLIGLLIQITYITVLLGGVLMIMGIKHALLIGVIFAILNLIPYVGALIGNIIGVLLTLTSSQDLSSVIMVLVAIAIVQFLDNNILMPRIVGSKVKLNALVSIVGVVIGGSLAGVAGMFLSLPMMAVLKIIFDKTLMFRQWGMLLGDANPKMSPISYPALRLKNKKLRESFDDSTAKEDEQSTTSSDK
jgi:predicted PurR-regulated permease PerM